MATEGAGMHDRVISPASRRSPRPPAPSPLFSHRFSPKTASVSLTPEPSTSSSASTSLAISPPRNRTPLSSTAGGLGKRSLGKAGRAWNRRLSFSTSSTSSSVTATPGQSGSATPCVFSFGVEEAKEEEKLEDAMSRMELDEKEGADAEENGSVTPRSARRIAARGSARKRRKARTGINVRSPLSPYLTAIYPRHLQDVPDELLLRIFSFLNEQQGFRPLPGRSSTTPEWYTPPLRIALVCKRWLPLARQLFYRFIKISHLSRIPLLYHTFSTTDLALSVRHLKIELPYSAVEQLGVLPITSRTGSNGAREPDSDLDRSVPSSGRSSPIFFGLGNGEGEDNAGGTGTPSKKKKQRRPLLPQDQLRAIFQSCSQLLSLEISGVAPAILFGSASSSSPSPSPSSVSLPLPPPSPSALHHLHLLRLSTVTSLTLKALPILPLPPPSSSSSPQPPHALGPLALRDALLALPSLTSLTLKHYSSVLSQPLSFAPTSTPSGLAARPLPSRARARALTPLRSLTLLNCSVSPGDLRALLKQLRPGSLKSLTVEEFWDPATARKRGGAGEGRGGWDRPAVEGLNAEGVKDLLQSLERLRVTLHNFPVLSSPFAPAVVVSPSLSSPSPASPRISRRHLPPSQQLQLQQADEAAQPPHILDAFIASLPNLTSLDVGGNVVTPSLFLPPLPSSHFPSSFSSSSSAPPPPPTLPPSVHTLTLRSCPGITPSVLRPLLLSQSSSSPFSPSGRIKSLRVFGSSEYGWTSPQACWDTQLVCWSSGVDWSSSPGGGSVGGKGGGGVNWVYGGVGEGGGGGEGKGEDVVETTREEDHWATMGVGRAGREAGRW
ncbi:hypothetical protein JCM8547_002243 [Rhodosporidiobolus lusitaniae]